MNKLITAFEVTIGCIIMGFLIYCINIMSSSKYETFIKIIMN